MSEITSAVIVQFDEQGDLSFHVFGGSEVRLFIVDERAPDDRVFELTRRADPTQFRSLIPEGSVIGSDQDDRHPAIEARVNAYVDGKPHLTVVDPSV